MSYPPTGLRPRPLLIVRGLTVDFRLGGRRPPLRAVDRVDLSIERGETLGLVGESGSGKTTIGRAVLGLTTPTAGKISFDDVDITHASYRQRRRLSSDMQVVFQDPYSSLNPSRTVGQTLAEPLRAHLRTDRSKAKERVEAALDQVGLDSSAAFRYPSEFSGGQRQRIAIARALVVNPRLIICDEPTSSLDLSVQAQVLNLFKSLQQELGLSYLFISHDLHVVRYLCHRVAVLRRGEVVEIGEAEHVYRNPRDSYTQALIDAAPVADPAKQRQRRLQRSRTTGGESMQDGHPAPSAWANGRISSNTLPEDTGVAR